jgi:hypothetical protein
MLNTPMPHREQTRVIEPPPPVPPRDRGSPASIDMSAEQQATDILARLEHGLVIEEALTHQLLQRYGLAG